MTIIGNTALMILTTMVMPWGLLAGQVDVDLVNGDLETGDLTGWTFVNNDGSFTNGKGQVVAVLPGDPDDKGKFVYEGNDYVQMLSASGDVWQGDTEYTVSLDIWRDPDTDANPFVSVNPANDNAPWSNWSPSSPWRFGIGGLNFQLTKGWDTYTVKFTTSDHGGAYIGKIIQLGLQMWSGSNDNFVRVDNVRNLRTVKAYKNPRNLTITAPLGATVSPAARMHVYEKNATVNISAANDYTIGSDTYIFDHWRGPGVSDPQDPVTTVKMDSSKTITAIYSFNGAGPSFEVLDDIDCAIDSKCAWPNLTLMPDGSIIATVFSSTCHLTCEGNAECWRSTDGGLTWKLQGIPAKAKPKTARYNVATGLAHNGDLVVLCSGWGYAPSFRDLRLPSWVCRSLDGGKTWTHTEGSVELPPRADEGEKMIKPFGDIAKLPGNRLAASFYYDYGEAFMLFSDDDGLTWGDGASIIWGYGETAHLRLSKDRWLVATRDEAYYGAMGPVMQFVSEDDGLTWKQKHFLTEVSQHPGHLLELADGRILLTFGMRDIYAIGFRISSDEGRTWQPTTVLKDLSGNPDCGYPATVQLDDGMLVTAYYASANDEHPRYRMGVVRWRIEDKLP